MARLRLFVKTPQGERVYDLDRDEVIVGRDPAADVSFDDRRASRRHCRLVRHVDGWRVEDLQSSNGTTLNGTPVAQARLTEGDRVGVGQALLTVSFPEVRDEVLTVARPVGSPVPPSRTPRDELSDLRREVRALSHLVAVNRRIAEAEEEGALLDAILDAAIELLEASRGLLLLSAEDHVTVRARAARAGCPSRTRPRRSR